MNTTLRSLEVISDPIQNKQVGCGELKPPCTCTKTGLYNERGGFPHITLVIEQEVFFPLILYHFIRVQQMAVAINETFL